MSEKVRPSHFQKRIFKWATEEEGNCVVEATAGSGKTTVIVALFNILAERYGDDFDGMFLAFNVDIIKELKNRLPQGANCKTINSLGHSALINAYGKLHFDADKYNNLAFESLKRLYIPKDLFSSNLSYLKTVVALAQANLIEGSVKDLTNLIEHYNLEIPKGLDFNTLHGTVNDILDSGLKLLTEHKIVGFDDQVWVPAKLKLPVEQSRFLMIDEAQDLSKAKLELIMLAHPQNGRIIAVGDKNQAIYSFSGSDIHSIDKIKERINPISLPLSISYRCGKNIVKEAQKLVSSIEATEDAIEGNVSTIEYEEMLLTIKPKDLILSRKNAPLVRTCIKLIKNKMPAKISGSDIGKQLVNTVKQILGKYGSWDNIYDLLQDYKTKETLRIKKNTNYSESSLLALYDRIAAIKAIIEGFNSSSFEEFSKTIKDIFSDKESLITLSTIHKAKGTEAENVFIIEKQDVPLRWKNQKDWEALAEKNLHYVAITRAKNNLYYVLTEKE